MFDWTITLGNVLSLVTMIGAFAAAHASNRERLARIETRLDYIDRHINGGPRR